MLTDRHARGQPSTCVRHKDFSCLTTGCPAQHVALVTKPTLLAGTPFISLRNTEDDRRCFPRWEAKWLPLSKSRGCTWLMDSCVSCEIVHTWRGQTGRKDKRQEERDEGKKTAGSCLDAMPEKGPTSLSDFKCPLCETVVSNAYNLAALPPYTSLIPSLSIYQHIMKHVHLHFHKCWLHWFQLFPVGFWQNSLLGINLRCNFLHFSVFLS